MQEDRDCAEIGTAEAAKALPVPLGLEGRSGASSRDEVQPDPAPAPFPSLGLLGRRSRARGDSGVAAGIGRENQERVPQPKLAGRKRSTGEGLQSMNLTLFLLPAPNPGGSWLQLFPEEGIQPPVSSWETAPTPGPLFLHQNPIFGAVCPDQTGADLCHKIPINEQLPRAHSHFPEGERAHTSLLQQQPELSIQGLPVKCQDPSRESKYFKSQQI